MYKSILFSVTLILAVLSAHTSASAQRATRPSSDMKPVLWERVNISRRDVYFGPGGKENQPDLKTVTFLKKETNGHQKKYRIKDGSGRIWIAKIGREAQPETAAVRLLWALGYKTEINYCVPTLTIPGIGTFKNVRLEARPAEIERLDEWKWKVNPFLGTRELQGLKIMMVFMNNWDVIDVQNKVLIVPGEHGKELHYIISDLGSTFGRLGNNNLPVLYRLGRKTGDPEEYADSDFIRRREDGRLVLSYKGKFRELYGEISVEDGRWLLRLLEQLTEKQIKDIFTAACYSPGDVEIFSGAVKSRIALLKASVQ